MKEQGVDLKGAVPVPLDSSISSMRVAKGETERDCKDGKMDQRDNLPSTIKFVQIWDSGGWEAWRKRVVDWKKEREGSVRRAGSINREEGGGRTLEI